MINNYDSTYLLVFIFHYVTALIFEHKNIDSAKNKLLNRINDPNPSTITANKPLWN